MKNITVRTEHAADYPVIGWIVTGDIWPKPCRLFAKLSDAKKYASDICKAVDAEFDTPAKPVIEWRTSTNGLKLESDYCEVTL